MVCEAPSRSALLPPHRSVFLYRILFLPPRPIPTAPLRSAAPGAGNGPPRRPPRFPSLPPGGPRCPVRQGQKLRETSGRVGLLRGRSSSCGFLPPRFGPRRTRIAPYEAGKAPRVPLRKRVKNRCGRRVCWEQAGAQHRRISAFHPQLCTNRGMIATNSPVSETPHFVAGGDGRSPPARSRSAPPGAALGAAGRGDPQMGGFRSGIIKENSGGKK